MFKFFQNCCHRNAQAASNSQIRADQARSELTIPVKTNTFDPLDSHRTYMLVKAETFRGSIDLEASYFSGAEDEKFQHYYRDGKAIYFEAQNPRAQNRRYHIYDSLSSLEHFQASDPSLMPKGAYILCFDKAKEEVYDAIANGNLHKAIVSAINYKDYCCFKRDLLKAEQVEIILNKNYIPEASSSQSHTEHDQSEMSTSHNSDEDTVMHITAANGK